MYLGTDNSAFFQTYILFNNYKVIILIDEIADCDFKYMNENLFKSSEKEAPVHARTHTHVRARTCTYAHTHGQRQLPVPQFACKLNVLKLIAPKM